MDQLPSELKQFNLTTERQTFSFTFTMEESTDVNGDWALMWAPVPPRSISTMFQ